MYKTIILPLAKQDIKEAANWYNKQNRGLGKRFTKEIRNKVKFIKNNPKAIAVRYDDIRAAVVDGFPFMIHFRIEENLKLVVIPAVYHTSQNPSIWERR
ncbi:MAG: type II toxin-antitoxin system RelE/ParE family toxin [Bacteroidetes bacterium]|nr:MAG: type II toxin-antitoxin system RelE/ParE family toxin [Bacteroidota bacterium]